MLILFTRTLFCYQMSFYLTFTVLWRPEFLYILPKKNDPMDKNFRPVSVLTTTSKLYENVLSEQLSLYFYDIFDQYLCAFRKAHGCQTTLLRLLEDWRGALDRHGYVAAVLMDLSKAFDCLTTVLLSYCLTYQHTA